MAENIQSDDATEHVDQEATQIAFGQGNVDTPSNAEGHVQSESINNSWEGDKRYESHWSKDPNKMYESLRYHEKRQGEFDNQINDYKSQLDQLQKDNQSYEALFAHEELGGQLENVIDQYINRGQQPQQEAPQSDNRIDDLLKWQQDIMSAAQDQHTTKMQEQAFSQIDSFAQEQQINYDKDDFVSHMKELNVPQEWWTTAFKGLAIDQIIASNRTKAAEQAITQANQNQSVLDTQNKGASSNDAPDSLEGFREKARGILTSFSGG